MLQCTCYIWQNNRIHHQCTVCGLLLTITLYLRISYNIIQSIQRIKAIYLAVAIIAQSDLVASLQDGMRCCSSTSGCLLLRRSTLPHSCSAQSDITRAKYKTCQLATDVTETVAQQEGGGGGGKCGCRVRVCLYQLRDILI